MSDFQIALLLHIVGAIVYFAGLVVATVALIAARRRERPSEIALLLRITPYGVILVGVGFLLLLGFGLWLIDLTPADFDQAWVSAALGLFIAAAIPRSIVAHLRSVKPQTRVHMQAVRRGQNVRRIG